jgi:RNA 2',3'-cyclic 3'-phosphodiesterase
MVPERTRNDKDPPPVRTFIAVRPPDPLCDHIAEVVRGRRRPVGAGRMAVDGVRWVPPENLHYTVKFLGELTAARLPEMEAALEAVGRRHVAFDAALAGGGCFPGAQRPRILWVGMGEGAAALTALAADVEAAVAPMGWEPERRPFKPHLTVGRVKRPTARSDAGDWVRALDGHAVGAFRVTELILFQSFLRAQGPLYTPLKRITLVGGGRECT